MTGVRDLLLSSLIQPKLAGSKSGGSSSRAAFQMHVCRWARFTFSSNVSVAGGRAFSLGVVVTFLLPVLDIHMS